MRIELIQRANAGPCIARVIDPTRVWDSVLFNSRPLLNVEQTIEEAQAWAVREFGRMLPVVSEIEILPYTKPTHFGVQHQPKRGHDPAYGINKPLATRTNWVHE